MAYGLSQCLNCIELHTVKVDGILLIRTPLLKTLHGGTQSLHNLTDTASRRCLRRPESEYDETIV